MMSATIAATATTRTRDAEPAEPFVGREEIADQPVGGEAERERDEDADRAERDAAEEAAAPRRRDVGQGRGFLERRDGLGKVRDLLRREGARGADDGLACLRSRRRALRRVASSEPVSDEEIERAIEADVRQDGIARGVALELCRAA